MRKLSASPPRRWPPLRTWPFCIGLSAGILAWKQPLCKPIRGPNPLSYSMPPAGLPSWPRRANASLTSPSLAIGKLISPKKPRIPTSRTRSCSWNYRRAGPLACCPNCTASNMGLPTTSKLLTNYINWSAMAKHKRAAGLHIPSTRSEALRPCVDGK